MNYYLIIILIFCFGSFAEEEAVWKVENKTEEEIEHAFRCAKRDMMNNRHGTPISTIRSILEVMSK